MSRSDRHLVSGMYRAGEGDGGHGHRVVRPGGIVISPSRKAFDFALAMCQKLNVKNTSIIVRMLLIVGLIVSPLYPPVFAASDQSAAMSAAHMSSDEMSSGADADNAASPCHDGKMDCDKACPCMAACMSLSAQCLPSTASIVARVVVVGQRLALSSEAQ